MFPWFRKKESAKVAKDRLQIAIMTDRANVKKELPFLDDLKRDMGRGIYKSKGSPLIIHSVVNSNPEILVAF